MRLFSGVFGSTKTLPLMAVGMAMAPQEPATESSAALLMNCVPSPMADAVKSSPGMEGMSLPWQAENPEQLLHLAKVSCCGVHSFVRMARPQSVGVPDPPAP